MEKILEQLLKEKRGTIKARRIAKIRTNTRTLEELSGKPIEEVLKSMDKVHELAEKIEAEDYAPHTKSDLRLMLKILWKVAHGYHQQDRPSEVHWIKVGVARKDKKHPKLISEEEYRKMLAVAGGRDKAILSLLYEAGLRPHELLSLKKTDIEFTKDGARIDVPAGTKTGARNVLVIDAEPAIAAWLSSHPSKKNDVLFPALIGEGWQKKMSVEGLNKMVGGTAKRAGIARKVKTYDFRHTAATRLAGIFTDAQMKAYFGWTQDSSMTATYINLSGRDVDAPLLAAHGKKVDKTELEGKLEPRICKRCGKQNAHDASMCQYCGMSFDKEQAKSDMLSMQEEIALLKKDRESMKAQIRQLAKQVIARNRL